MAPAPSTSGAITAPQATFDKTQEYNDLLAAQQALEKNQQWNAGKNVNDLYAMANSGNLAGTSGLTTGQLQPYQQTFNKYGLGNTSVGDLQTVINSLKGQADVTNSYNQAQSALVPAEQADVNEFNRTSPFVQRQMLGMLNSRGLGSSVLAGGSGSGGLSELANRQKSELSNIQGGYQSLSDSLTQGLKGSNINYQDFLNSLQGQQAAAQKLKQQQAFDPFDILGLSASVGKYLGG